MVRGKDQKYPQYLLNLLIVTQAIVVAGHLNAGLPEKRHPVIHVSNAIRAKVQELNSALL